MQFPLFCPAELLIPEAGLLPRWSVVACDQFTSEPEYWNAVAALTADVPSAYHITLPEIYLNDRLEERIRSIEETMLCYQQEHIFRVFPHALVYIERRLSSGRIRRGLVGAVDLEAYDYSPASTSPIRATEQTVLSRVPPRVNIRKNASLELPHIMLLIHDRRQRIFSAVDKTAGAMIYDFDLMQDGGHISGYLLDGERADRVCDAFASLDGSIKIAVGDGNHSLAAAKACYEALKQAIGVEAASVHPARYALAEVVDIGDDSLAFEPIHRTIFHTDPSELLDWLRNLGGRDYTIRYVDASGEGEIAIPANGNSLPCGALQQLLDCYVAQHGGTIDYIHGDETARMLGRQADNLSFLLPVFDKTALFDIVERDGTLPRKAFSMGHASDKRYYLECRRIR